MSNENKVSKLGITGENAYHILKDLRIRNYNKIIIGHLNINSVRNKFEQLKTLVDSSIDILVITETKLDESFPKSQFKIPGFSKPFWSDRIKNGGGILAYVREDIPSKELDRHTFPHDIEGIFFEINLRKTKWLLCATYHPPSQSDNYYFNFLERALDIYNDFYDNFLLIGDFNSEETEPHISDFLDQYSAKNLVKEKTCFKNVNNPSCIDLLITNRCNSFQNTTVLSTGLSDFHKMVVTALKCNYTQGKPKQVNYRDYKKFDNKVFNKDLKESLSKQSLSSYSDFQTIFLRVLERHAPTKKKVIRANHAPYMTKQLRKAIMKRSELQTRYYKYKTSSDLIAFKKQKNFVSKLYKKERKKFYSNLNLNDITDNRKFWKTVKPLISNDKSQDRTITLIDGEKILTDDEEVAKTFNSFFVNAVKSLDIKENTYLTNSTHMEDNPINNAIDRFAHHPSILMIKKKVTPVPFSFSEIDLKEVERELQQLDTSKANRLGSIPPKHLKQSSEVCGPVLLNLINDSIRDGYFPKELKLADVTPVYKKDDATSVKNYRPVSVLPVVSKIYERLIQRQVITHIDRYLSNFLCGYRKGYNTQHALISLIEKWKSTLDKQGYAGAVLMDLSKAFDTLNHELLIAKLHAYGFSKESLKLVLSYLTNRWQRTKINKSFSSWSELLQGVPQGSVLGPLLFNIYINDLFWLNEQTYACNYADDTTLYACDKNLESVLLNLEHDSLLAIDWFESNYMKLNSDKCHLLISGFKHQSHWAQIGEYKIWESSHKKLLGVEIDNGLKFNLHINNICKKANMKLSALARISRLIPLNQRRILFKSFVESQFAYCPLVWMFHDRSLNNKINRLHERALRIVYKDDSSSFQYLLEKDKSVSIHHQNIQALAVELYKFSKGLSIDLMEDIFSNRRYNGPKLRTNVELKIPFVRTVYKGEDSLRNLGPKIWQIVPENLKELHSLEAFKTCIKSWVPHDCPCRLCKEFVPGLGYLT